MAELAGKHVLVTGASRGIGAAAAVALAAAGAALTLAARDPERLAEVAGGIVAAGGRAETAVGDVANYSAVSAVVEEARRRLGPIDAVINNAGVVEPIGRVSDGDPAAWARSIGINLIGAYNVIRAVLPGMLRAGSGVIVNLSSGAATTPLEGWSAYCSSKAGLAMLTRMVTLEAGPAGIRAFGFSPGTTDTDMHVLIRASGINRISQIPREALTPVALPASAIVYLCTPEAEDLAGTEITLNNPDFRRRVGLA